MKSAAVGSVLKKPAKRRTKQVIDQEIKERIKEAEDREMMITPTLEGALYKILAEIKAWDIALTGFGPELWEDKKSLELVVSGISRALHQLKANLSAKLYG